MRITTPLQVCTSALILLALTSSPARADDAPSNAPHSPTAEEVVTAYVRAEQQATGLSDFCARTREFVVTASDYPKCPPHDHLFIVDVDASRVSCRKVGADATNCTVRYIVIATSGPELGMSDLTGHRRQKLEETFEVSTKTNGLISDPYKPPHIGVGAALSAIQAERIRARAEKAAPEYLSQLSRIERQLSTKGAK